MSGKAAAICLFITLLISPSVSAQDSSGFSTTYNSRARIIRNDPNNIDVKLFRLINNNRTSLLSTILTVTDYSLLPVAVILPASMFVYGRAKDRTYDENSAVLMALSEAASLALTTGLKYIVKRPRPYKTLSNVNLNKGILGDPYSFPSGHTSTAFSIATSLVLRYPKYPQVYVPAYLYGLIMGYGRVYFGMHYPTDVLGGAVLGSLAAAGVYSMRSEIIRFKNRVFREENKPDRNNYDSKSIAIISASYITAILANELSRKIEVYPFANSTKEFNCLIRLNF